MNPYDPTNRNDPADRPTKPSGRQTVERYLSLPFYVQSKVLLELGVEAQRPDERAHESDVRAAATIKERGLVPQFAELVDREWAKRAGKEGGAGA